MTSLFSIFIMDKLIEFQDSKSIDGDFAEIGSYKGRVSKFMYDRLKDNERLLMVDIENRKLIQSLNLINKKVIEMHISTQSFKFKIFAMLNKKKFKLIHIDGSHEYIQTKNEIKSAFRMLKRSGILVLDDFNTMEYPQVIAAAFKNVFRLGSKKRIFLIVENKAYICHKGFQQIYGEFSLKILPLILGNEQFQVKIAKTDYNKKINVVSIEDMSNNSNFYANQTYFGEELYKNFLDEYKPSLSIRIRHKIKNFSMLIYLNNLYKSLRFLK